MVVKAIEPLHDGDRLTAAEFERRYEAMSEGVKAELIDGVVYMASAVRYTKHAEQHGSFMGILSFYSAYTPGTSCGDNATVRVDESNQPQPDCCLLIDAKRGGRAEIDDDGYIQGTPELVAEVAASSADYDLGAKLETYRNDGAPEYLVWRVDDEQIDWFVLHAGQYDPMNPDADGILKSTVFPGLWLDAPAMLRKDMVRVFEVLKAGLDSREHAEFVRQLQHLPT